jgi:hypothetical protein
MARVDAAKDRWRAATFSIVILSQSPQKQQVTQLVGTIGGC